MSVRPFYLAVTGVTLCACSSSTVIGSSYGAAGAGARDGGAPSTDAAADPDVVGPGGTFPYPATHYDEPYRGQFHFSTAGNWMNDVDGLWYYGGVYHLTYQAAPYALAIGKDVHWGHATSTDLLHWVQQPLMLIPGVNALGDAWSGSVVVDVNDTAGLKTGQDPVFVAAYTATAAGTSLAYSIDLGRTWQGYSGNPVAIGNADFASNRDPAVVWHEPSARWVCAYWENGTTFYTSPDLKNWTRASNVAFGQLVPDFYEVPIDGDAANTRWVLQDASGAYLIGRFDGQSFTADPGGPYAMDVGPSFYASHTFFRPTFPDRRVVQIGWIRNAGVPTAPWRGDATFPVELELRTFPEGVRLTRTPIAEIEKIYGNRRHWDAALLPSGKNLLAGMNAKSYDFEIVLGGNGTTATQIHFQLANKAVVYDLVRQTLLGATLVPLDGRVKIRILADWGQLEVFGNDGQLSYTASFGFTPSDSSLSLTADGDVAILSADFREVNRIWPGRPGSSVGVLDDTSPDVAYVGSWNTVTGDPTFYDGTCHYSTSAAAAFEATFTGTRVDWYGLKNVDLGKADVFVDGARVAQDIDCYSPKREMLPLFTKGGLPNTFHAVRIVATGTKNAASSGTALVHDYFLSSVEP